jgi:LCP family protein required for cell wall assembly
MHAGGLLVVIATAAISASLIFDQLHGLAEAISATPSLKVSPGALAPAGLGAPHTLLLVGNDQRNHTTTAPVLPHSNETLLVRLDPSKPWISMMSIPRELWVPIDAPGGTVTTRFNYAYTAGGMPLLVSTIKNVLGLSVNHVIVIDFNNFKKAVYEMGCVYSTVDRPYYHVDTPYSEQYQPINLPPGYQRMCGETSLEYVSYRHGDTSLVRDARNQGFLLDAEKESGPTLIDNLGKFERIFGAAAVRLRTAVLVRPRPHSRQRSHRLERRTRVWRMQIEVCCSGRLQVVRSNTPGSRWIACVALAASWCSRATHVKMAGSWNMVSPAKPASGQALGSACNSGRDDFDVDSLAVSDSPPR